MPLNILHIVQRYPPALGGSEAYFARLSQWLAQRGHRVTVWTTDAKDLSAFWDRRAERFQSSPETDSSVAVKRFPIDHWPMRRVILKAISIVSPANLKGWSLPVNPISFSMLKEAKRSQEPFDLVHATAFPYLFPCLCGLKLARRLKIPFVLTPFVHIGPWKGSWNPIRKAYLAKPMRWLLRQADLVFVQTPSEKREVLAVGVAEEKIVMQGLGVNIEEVTGGDRSKARGEWGLTEDQIAVGHLANQSFEKGTMHLLEAAKKLHPGLPNFKVILAGPKMPDFDYFYLRGISNLSDFAIQLGPLTEGQKKDFFAGIDMFCLPSISDSFGLVLLEAMANGKPCLGYRAGGIGDVLNGPGGELVDFEHPSKPFALGAKLHEMIRNGKLKEMGLAGLERCQKEFQWQPKLELVEKALIYRVLNR